MYQRLVFLDIGSEEAALNLLFLFILNHNIHEIIDFVWLPDDFSNDGAFDFADRQLLYFLNGELDNSSVYIVTTNIVDTTLNN